MPLFLVALAAAAGPIVKQVLLSLGIGFISYAVLIAVIEALVQHVQSSYGQLAQSTAQIADLLGVGTAIGIVLGGISARAAYAAITRLGKLSS